MKPLSAVLAAALLAACGRADEAPPPNSQTAQEAPPEDQSHVACATDGAESFRRVCTIERVSGRDGVVLVLRAPEGGFRRLLVTGDGKGVTAADGAEPALVTPVGEGLIEVAIGRDRYRLPATVKAGAR